MGVPYERGSVIISNDKMEFWSVAIEVFLPFEYVVLIGYHFKNEPCVANRFISLITIKYIGALNLAFNMDRQCAANKITVRKF